MAKRDKEPSDLDPVAGASNARAVRRTDVVVTVEDATGVSEEPEPAAAPVTPLKTIVAPKKKTAKTITLGKHKR